MNILFIKKDIFYNGYIDIISITNSTFFELVILSDSNTILYKIIIDTNAKIRQKYDIYIIYNDFLLKFSNSLDCNIVFLILYIIYKNEGSLILDIPTFDNIEKILKNLKDAHHIIRHVVISSVIRPGFIESIYSIFNSAEISLNVNKYTILHTIYNIMICFFQLESQSILSIILNPNNIDNTVACLEYNNINNNTHRSFLRNTKLYIVLPLLHDKLKPLARTNYYIGYIKNVILDKKYESINTVIINNNCLIIEIIEKNAKQIVGSIIPIIIYKNNKLILSAKPNVKVLQIIIELLKLDVPQTTMYQMVNTLHNYKLLKLLDFIFSYDCILSDVIINIFTILYNIIPDIINEYMYQSKMIPTIINNINYSQTENIDCYIYFLQLIIMKSNLEQVSQIINTFLPKLIIYYDEKHRRIYEFIDWLFQSYPILCRPYFNKCVNLFINLTKMFLHDNKFTLQKKLVYLSLSQLICNFITNSYETLVDMNFFEYLISIILANGKNNILNSVLQCIIRKMTEDWINILIKKNSKFVNKLSQDKLIDIIKQISFAVTSGIDNITTDISDISDISNNYNVINVINNKQILACHRIVFIMSTLIRRKQTNAISRWKSYFTKSDGFLVEAVFVIADKRSLERNNMIKFMIRKYLLPILRRANIRIAFQKWHKNIQ